MTNATFNEDVTANFKTSRATFETLGRNLEVYNSIGTPNYFTTYSIEGELNYSGANNGHCSDNAVNNTTLSVDWQLDGLTFTSAKILSKIKGIQEFNIGHFLIGESIFEGMPTTIKKFKKILRS